MSRGKNGSLRYLYASGLAQCYPAAANRAPIYSVGGAATLSLIDPLHRTGAPTPIVVSGPMGAELVDRGVRWRGHGMLTDTDAVRALYVEYLEAGCDVLRTNTFQLNRRIYLDVFRDPDHMAHIGAPGLATRHVDLTRRAVALAREAREQSGRN